MRFLSDISPWQVGPRPSLFFSIEFMSDLDFFPMLTCFLTPIRKTHTPKIRFYPDGYLFVFGQWLIMVYSTNWSCFWLVWEFLGCAKFFVFPEIFLLISRVKKNCQLKTKYFPKENIFLKNFNFFSGKQIFY